MKGRSEAGASSRGKLKTVLLMAGELVGAVAVGTLLLCLVFLLPDGPADKHLERSVAVFEEEGTYPRLSQHFTSKLDNFTDAIMLGSAADSSEAGCLERAMRVTSGHMNGMGPAESLIAHYRDGLPYDTVSGYPRYWHGYLVPLRPLLSVMDYSAIRVLNGICQLALVAAVCVLLKRRGLGNCILPWLIAYGMLMPLALAKSLQFSACFYVFCFGALALLLIRRDNLNMAAVFVFLGLGIGTAYFDFLTYPMATFGVPAVFLLLLCREDGMKEKLITLVKAGLAWCVGYGGMWVSKFLLAGLVTGENVLADGLGEVGVLMAATDGVREFDALTCLMLNIRAFLRTPVTIPAVLFALYALVRCLRGGKKPGEGVKLLLPYALLCLAPLVWYAVTLTHSSVHYWFTNKACVVCLLAVLFGLTDLAEGPPSEGRAVRGEDTAG